ncbi:hypothetical protein [Actinopolymorpha sp. B9G3]|uniref:hypothetical protein n=1 Tax=Actinopolymorpha sp. B9G3 TaxID=3158970 RepID=UPI0032D9874F
MTSPPGTTPRWVIVVLGILALFVVGYGLFHSAVLAIVGILTLLCLVASSRSDSPSAVEAPTQPWTEF